MSPDASDVVCTSTGGVCGQLVGHVALRHTDGGQDFVDEGAPLRVVRQGGGLLDQPPGPWPPIRTWLTIIGWSVVLLTRGLRSARYWLNVTPAEPKIQSILMG